MLINLQRKLEKINNINSKLAYWLNIILVFSVTSLILTEVIFRNIGRSISWSEELARWCLVSITFIASFSALQEGSHVGITSILTKLPHSIKKIVLLVSNILVLIFLIYLFRYGMKAALGAYNETGGIIQISMFYVKLSLPLGAFMMIIFIFSKIIGILICPNNQMEEFMLSKNLEEKNTGEEQ
jgi:TRAP-type transport system small permease protein